MNLRNHSEGKSRREGTGHADMLAAHRAVHACTLPTAACDYLRTTGPWLRDKRTGATGRRVQRTRPAEFVVKMQTSGILKSFDDRPYVDILNRT